MTTVIPARDGVPIQSWYLAPSPNASNSTSSARDIRRSKRVFTLCRHRHPRRTEERPSRDRTRQSACFPLLHQLAESVFSPALPWRWQQAPPAAYRCAVWLGLAVLVLELEGVVYQVLLGHIGLRWAQSALYQATVMTTKASASKITGSGADWVCSHSTLGLSVNQFEGYRVASTMPSALAFASWMPP